MHILILPCRKHRRGGTRRCRAAIGQLLIGWCILSWGGAWAADRSPSEKPARPSDSASIVGIAIYPEGGPIPLVGHRSTRGLRVDAQLKDGQWRDVTRDVHYQSSDPKVVTISATGVLEAHDDGDAEIHAQMGDHRRVVPVRVSGTKQPRTYHFENDIVPLLSRTSCNMSACHGKAEGQNGFKLSVFGSDPIADRSALSHDRRGRRIFPAAPERSLLLTKATGEIPHGGGQRFTRASKEYEILRGWIAAGAPVGATDAPHLVAVEMEPSERTLTMGGTQQLRVMARYSDGSQVDVTEMSRYQSNNEALAQVNDSGWVETGQAPGQVAIMVSYSGEVDTFQAIIPRAEPLSDDPIPAPDHFIDRLVQARLQRLHIKSSRLADDATYLRRVYLDIIGTLPTAAEARNFLEDTRADKRQRTVASLLERPEYADYWSLKWADVLRVDRLSLGRKGAYAYHRWIRDAFAVNKPFDQFVRELLTAEGSLAQAPQAHFFKVVNGPGDSASSLAQIFLGIRISCAQCHHHPYDRWSQDDYYGMTAYFQPLTRQTTMRGEMTMVSGPFMSTNPRSGKDVMAHPLGNQVPAELPAGDARRGLAQWMTGPENPWFARNFVNRVWAHFLGRGLVTPVDDFRDTNPPSNPELLTALAEHFVAHRYDVKDLIATITASETYQQSSAPNKTNELDEQNYSRSLLRKLDAEVLLDAVSQVAGVPDRFPGTQRRAIEQWDSDLDHYFLTLFGRPTRKTTCVCERTVEPNVGQVLHLLNAPEIHDKLRHDGGRIRTWMQTIPDDRLLVDELYLTGFARLPSADEAAAALEHLARADHTRGADGRRLATEDLVWSLMNTLEFSFNH